MIRKALSYFSESLSNLTTGRKFRGQLLQIPVSETTNSFIPARRFLKTEARSDVQPGHVIQTRAGIKYLAAYRGHAEYRGEVIYRTLRLYQVTDEVISRVAVEEADDIIGRTVLADAGYRNKGTIYCAIEPIPLEGDGMQVQNKTVRVITNSNLAVGSTLDGKYKITDNDAINGLYFLKAIRL